MLQVAGTEEDDTAGDRQYLVLAKPNVIMNDTRRRRVRRGLLATYVRRVLERWSHWPGYGYADLAKITVPTLILLGDRDHLCSVEEATVAFRNLGHGQLAVIPNLGHVISTGKIEALVSFLAS